MNPLERALLLGLDQAPEPPGEELIGLDTPPGAWGLWLREGGQATAQLAGQGTAGSTLPQPAPEDPRPVIPGTLAAVIPLALQRRLPWLLQELSAALDKRGARVSAGSLPALLNAHEELRPAVIGLLGPVGLWLAAQSPSWSWALGQADSSWRAEFEEGAGVERVRALERGRGIERDLATTLLLETLPQESAAERERLVEACRVGLSSLDVGWLEELAGADRSKKVRRAARDLLILLPQSPLAQRRKALAQECLALEEQTRSLASRLMRSRRVLKLSAQVPPEEEGLVGEKHWGLGPGQGRLAALVASVDPTTWTERWGTDPGRLVLAVDKSEDIAVLVGWTEAAIRFASQDWAGPLERLWTEAGGRLAQSFVERLPAVMRREDLESRCLDQLQRHSGQGSDLLRVLEPLPTPWSPRVAQAWLSRVRSYQSLHTLPRFLAPTLELGARGLPPQMLPAHPLLPATSASVVLKMATVIEARRRIHAYSLG